MPSLRERWIKDPYCQKCGCLTVLPKKGDCKIQFTNSATLEHIYPKSHPLRKETKIVLYCYQCNQFANILWKRTGLLYSDYTFVLNESIIIKLKGCIRRNKTKEEVQEENKRILSQLFSLRL